MKPCCPLCGADHCPETRPDCRARGDARRALYDRANGFEPRVYLVPPSLLARVERLVRKATRPRQGPGNPARKKSEVRC